MANNVEKYRHLRLIPIFHIQSSLHVIWLNSFRIVLGRGEGRGHRVKQKLG